MNVALMIPGRAQCPHSSRMLTEVARIYFWSKFWRLMDMGFGTSDPLLNRWDLSQVTQPLSGSFILFLRAWYCLPLKGVGE